MKKDILSRALIVLSVLLLVSIILIIQVIFVQTTKKYKLKNSANIQESKILAGRRGDILSENNFVLSTSKVVYEIACDPYAFSDIDFRKKRIDSICAIISDFFKEKSKWQYIRDIVEKRKKQNMFYSFSKRKLSNLELEKLKKPPLYSKNRWIKGFINPHKSKIYYRYRPLNDIGRRTIGITNQHQKDTQKYSGLENTYHEILNGEDGEAVFQAINNNKSNLLSFKSHSQDGFDILTTIDTELQQYMHKILNNSLAKHRAEYGSAILMEVKTGEIKAIVNLKKGNDGKYRESYNYSIAPEGVREPGSVFKTISMLTLLELTNTSIYDSVNIEKGQYQFFDSCIMRDSEPHEYQKISIQKAFEISSNVGISKIIFENFKDNPEEFINHIKSLLDYQDDEILMKNEGSISISGVKSKIWSKCSIPWRSIGYEIKLSPLHILIFYNGIANNGKIIKPIIVKKILKNGKIRKTFSARTIKNRFSSAKNLGTIKKLLENVIENGTARNIKSSIYKIAGKTGTTQKIENGKYVKKYYTSFVGYFPADNPIYSCIVVVDEPRGAYRYGGSVCAPIFKSIAKKIYKRRTGINKSIVYSEGVKKSNSKHREAKLHKFYTK